MTNVTMIVRAKIAIIKQEKGDLTHTDFQRGRWGMNDAFPEHPSDLSTRTYLGYNKNSEYMFGIFALLSMKHLESDLYLLI